MDQRDQDLLQAELNGLSYEQLLDQLEILTQQLASGELGIERAADLYEKARIIHKVAQYRLDSIRSRLLPDLEEQD